MKEIKFHREPAVGKKSFDDVKNDFDEENFLVTNHYKIYNFKLHSFRRKTKQLMFIQFDRIAGSLIFVLK